MNRTGVDMHTDSEGKEPAVLQIRLSGASHDCSRQNLRQPFSTETKLLFDVQVCRVRGRISDDFGVSWLGLSGREESGTDRAARAAGDAERC
jgi:hypothetical protein